MSNVIKSTYIKVNDSKSYVVQTKNGRYLNNMANQVMQEDEFYEEDFSNNIIDLEAIKDEANQIIHNAKEQGKIEAEKIRQNTIKELEQYKMKIEEESRQKGYQEGYQQAINQQQSILQEVENIKKQTKNDREQLLSSIEPKMIDLIIQICGNLINTELKFNDETILNLIKKGFSQLKNKNEIKVRVGQEQYSYVIAHKNLLLEGMDNDVDIEIVSDSNLTKGDCIIETPYGNVDCCIKDQFDRVKKELHLIMSSAY